MSEAQKKKVRGKIDTDELGLKLIEILSKITKEIKNELIAGEILEETDGPQYDSFIKLVHSMAYHATKNKLNLISADSPMTLHCGWADINSERLWEIGMSNLKRSLNTKDSDIIMGAMFERNNIFSKALEVVCNAY